jgi:hypothetical protein
MDVGLLSDMALCPLRRRPARRTFLRLRRFLAPQLNFSNVAPRKRGMTAGSSRPNTVASPKLLFYFYANFVEPRFAAFGAVAIDSKVAFQLRDAIASGLKLLRQPLRGFHGLPAVLIGRVCCLVQKTQDRLPSLVDKLDVLRITVTGHASACRPRHRSRRRLRPCRPALGRRWRSPCSPAAVNGRQCKLAASCRGRANRQGKVGDGCGANH